MQKRPPGDGGRDDCLVLVVSEGDRGLSHTTPEDVSQAPSTDRSLRESDDCYQHVICMLDGRRRVIDCADGIQWILQVRSGAHWLNRSFFRNRDVLIERSGATGEALAILRRLPERHP
jgi:hypothetical protein